MNVIRCTVGIMQTNCYIVYSDTSNLCAVIDPGDEADKILGIIAEHSLTVDKIFLTHGHFDHILAVNELREKTGAPLYVCRDEEKLLSDRNMNLCAVFARKSDNVSKADVTVSDGDTIEVGNMTFTVIQTPGHTDGSVCYISGDVLFSGDTLFNGGMGRCDFPTGDEDKMKSSLKKLCSIPHDCKVYSGHGNETTLYEEKKNNPYLINLQ